MLVLISTIALCALFRTARGYITCSPYTNFGVSKCPYAAATTAQIDSAITQYCSGTCVVEGNSVPCSSQSSYTLSGADGLFVQVSVATTAEPGQEGASACEENLTEVVQTCDAEYGEFGWLGGVSVVEGYPSAYQVWVCAIGD